MRIFLILFSLVLTMETAFAEETSSSRIAAVVNKSIISQSDLNNRLKLAIISSGLQQTPDVFEKMKPQLLRLMIEEQLQLQVAEKHKIKVSDKQIKSAIKHLEESNGMPEGAVMKLLESNNIPMNTLETQIRANLSWISYMREKYYPTLQIADAELDHELKVQEEKETKIQYHLAEIVLTFDSPDQEERVKADLNRLVEELQKGAHFTALAQQFSTAPTAAQGGDMGWLTEDQLAPEIKEAVTHLAPGQLSQPVRTSQSYVLLAFIEQKKPGAEGRTLLTLQQALLPFPKDVNEEKARSIMELAVAISKSSKNCPDLVKKAKEKYSLAESHLAKKKSADDLPDQLKQALLPLGLNKASEPFLTEDGALIFMVCEKEIAEEKKLTKEDVRDLLIERKLSLLSRRELRDLRRNAFIEMRM